MSLGGLIQIIGRGIFGYSQIVKELIRICGLRIQSEITKTQHNAELKEVSKYIDKIIKKDKYHIKQSIFNAY